MVAAVNDPHATAVFLFSIGALLCIATVLSRASGRIGLPVALGFLGVGMVAGSEGPGGIDFEDYGLAMRVGTAALTLILFDGGLHTPLPAFKAAFRPAAVLATAGVAGTALLASLAARAIGFGWHEGLLFGAVVSSTDAAGVFSVLKMSGVQLRHGVGLVLELESGLNDPMAVLLTLALATRLTWRAGLVEGLLELAVAPHGLVLALFLAVVARPLVVLLCLLPFRLPLRHILCIGWVGLRGAVPIILATFPVLLGVPRGREIFDLVFFVVVVNAVVPGWTVPWVAKRLGVGTDAKPAPRALLEIQSSRPLHSELLSFLIEPASAVAGSRIADLPFPEDASILL